MKKVFLCICVAAIVALATVNLSLAFKNEAKVANLTLLGTESLAQGEGGGGEGSCQDNIHIIAYDPCRWSAIWYCTSGSYDKCFTGRSDWNDCAGTRDSDVKELDCP